MASRKGFDYMSVRSALDRQVEKGRLVAVSATWTQGGSARITVTDHRRTMHRMTVDEAYTYLQGLVAPERSTE